MKSNFCLTGLMVMILFLSTSCTTYHFGVANRAATVPDDFGQTEAVLARAEQSQGAQYCPEKIAKAKELAKQGAEVYWTCHNSESSRLLAEARQLAEEAERCGPQVVEAPPVVAPAPKPLAPTSDLSISPASIRQGESAKLNWTSQNATECDIQPGIGPVKPQGTADITPSADTTYNLVCTGAGGKADSSASITVVVPTKEELCMTLHIEYDTDKSIIKPAFYGEVEKVANFMKRFPQIKGTIEGHTDNIASAKYNVKLSQRRAAGVVKMLVGKYGIDKSRLAAKGYGLTKPIASNKTVEGRQKNRRTMANFGCVTIEK
ncbi:MAG TPA: OmpA family protein [Geobacteraceae bacterium]|nr:OmpA family protein [Geobacteraceae bacterium]